MENVVKIELLINVEILIKKFFGKTFVQKIELLIKVEIILKKFFDKTFLEKQKSNFFLGIKIVSKNSIFGKILKIKLF